MADRIKVTRERKDGVMSRHDVVVWEVVGEAFWLVALVAALIIGLIA